MAAWDLRAGRRLVLTGYVFPIVITDFDRSVREKGDANELCLLVQVHRAPLRAASGLISRSGEKMQKAGCEFGIDCGRRPTASRADAGKVSPMSLGPSPSPPWSCNARN
jgi:hypothetical protein